MRIVERTSASGSITQEIEYIYDAFDQRVGKRLDSDGNGTWDRDEAYVWTEGQTHLRLTDSDGEGTTETFHVASRYLYGDIVDHLLADEQFADGAGPAADATTASTTAGETLWALVDHLGSLRDLVANGGVIREHVVYDSFGNRLVEQDYDSSGNAISSSHAEAVDSLFGYTGRDWDADAGLQYNRARWYDPATGRWLSQDPIGFEAGDANLYRYVGNRATTKTDPSGLAEGHHWVPTDVAWRLHQEGILTQDELIYFASRSSGPLRNPHNWWSIYNGECHEDYSNAVETELRAWKKSSGGRRFSAKDVVDNIRDGRTWNGNPNAQHGITSNFNSGVMDDMVDRPQGQLNYYDGQGRSPLQDRRRGLSSLNRRGKFLIFFGGLGSLSSLLDAKGIAAETTDSLSGEEMQRALAAAERGDLARARICLTGTGHPQRSVYESLQAEVGTVLANAFLSIVDPQLEQLIEDARRFEQELSHLR